MLHKQLMEDFNGRKEYAWKHFFKEHYRPLVFFAQMIVNDLQDAEDVVSSCFEKILMSENLVFETPEKLKAFLYITVRNDAFDLQATFGKSRSSCCDHLTLEREANAMAPIPEEGKVQTLVRIREYIERMPAAVKEVLLMHFFEGWTTVDIAKLKKISKQTVRNQVSAGLRRLKQWLQVPQVSYLWMLLFGKWV